MKVCLNLFICCILYFPTNILAQTTYLPEGSKEYNLLERLEIKAQKNTNIIFSTVKPYSRKFVVEEANYFEGISPNTPSLFTAIDLYNLQRLKNNSEEWDKSIDVNNKASDKRFHTFYKTRQHLAEVHDNGFFLALDPVFQLQEGGESLTKQNVSLSTYGIIVRGEIAHKLGFSFTVSDNNEKGPEFFKQRVMQYNAVPGEGYFKTGANGSYNYLDARGYVTFTIAKYIDVQAGYDKNFIGNGYRSMFLSDYSSSFPFVKINTRIWKLNYENIFARQEPLDMGGVAKTSMKKYFVMHHLSMNIGRKLNLGVFEAESSARSSHIDFEYLNPIIFLRQVEGNIGSPDKAHVGIDVKENFAQRFQFYGQFMLDEFLLHQFIHHTGFWANKWAVQAGIKYVDALNIKNLDVQLEANVVRPFTYTHFDPVTNYSNYNQPLADPLGANFHEIIGIFKYQPAVKWHINGRAIYYNQGLDSAGKNLGSNIFLDYRTRPRDYGFKIAGGNRATCINASLNIAYELYDNLYIEATGFVRKYTVENGTGNNSTGVFTLGVRWNIFKRDYDY